MSTQTEAPVLGELTTTQFRQKLAGLLDPQESQTPERKQDLKELAVYFVSELPEVFGKDLDRKTLWDRIGTSLQAAFAKTAGEDYAFFIHQVLEHIKAEPARAVLCEGIASTMATLDEWSPSDRQAWITYFNTHSIPVLVLARQAWERTKQQRNGGAA